jgi:hypothetical protein
MQLAFPQLRALTVLPQMLRQTLRVHLAALLVLEAAATLPRAVRAQVPVPTPPPATVPILQTPVIADSVPAFERPNGALMRPGSLSYQLSLDTPHGQRVALGMRTVTVSDASLGGNPGWLIADTRTGTVVPTSDSVFVARADLMPERWSATIGRAQLGASFTRDSVIGAVQSYQGRASFSLPVPANVLLSAGMVERVLELLPLREGYRAAVSLLLVDGPEPRVVPAEIVVERSERVMVGNGAVDAWRVALRWGAMEQRLWIARDGTRVVRTEQALPEGVLTSVLQP